MKRNGPWALDIALAGLTWPYCCIPMAESLVGWMPFFLFCLD